MVDTKDQSNAIVYWVWYLVHQHCRYKDQSMQCIEYCLSRLSILLSKYIHTFLPTTFLMFNGFSIRKKFLKANTQGFSTIPSILYKTRIPNAFNAIYVNTDDTRQGSLMHSMLCWHCRYKTHRHIPAHNFNIQPILNPQKVKEIWDSGLFNYTINTIYVDTVDTRQGSLMHSMHSMSTLSIVFTPHSTVYKVLCKIHKHQCQQCRQNSIKCIVYFIFISTVSTNKIPYSIYTIAFLLSFLSTISTCPSCPFELQCTF